MDCCDLTSRVYLPVDRLEGKLDKNVPNSLGLTDMEHKLGVVVAERHRRLTLWSEGFVYGVAGDMHSSKKLCLHVVSFDLRVFEDDKRLFIDLFSLVQKWKDFSKFQF